MISVIVERVPDDNLSNNIVTSKGYTYIGDPDAKMSREEPPVVPEIPAPPPVSAIQIKLPPFWPKDPALWFAQIEAQFTTRGITVSKTKFEYVVSSLSPEYATEVRDLLLSPPAEQPYEQLKRELTNRTSVSKQRRLQQLLTSEEIGDRKPSQLLRHIQQLLGDKLNTMDATFLRELFLQRLPSNVRMVLTPSAGDLNLDQLAQLADRIMEASPLPTIAATTSTTDQLTAQVSTLTKRLDELSMQMSKAVNTFSRRPGRSPSPARRRRQSTSSDPAAADNLCWYHRRFGEAAQKCQPPCQKSGNTQASR